MIRINLHRWFFAIVLYIIIVLAILAIRPAFMFNEQGQLKEWSLTQSANTTIFGAQIVFPILAFLCYYLTVLIEVFVPKI
jgi:hypothetical protein